MPRIGTTPVSTKQYSGTVQYQDCGHPKRFFQFILMVFTGLISPFSQSFEFEANVLSDYSFRGISQTKGSPSYQLGMNFLPLAPLPIYAGADLYRIYQINENERSKHEVNYHLGLEKSLTDRITSNIGITWHTYHGHSKSDQYSKSQERNYPEWHLGLTYEQKTSVYVYYTDDALGSTNARNLAFELRHLTPTWVDIEFYVGRVTSLDKDKLRWDDDERYLYFGLMFEKSIKHWQASLTFEATSINARLAPDMKDRGERKVIASFGYRWSNHKTK